MRFSIIVPIYNIEKYINECLSSIQNQTFKDFECIMVDDGSTDKSAGICDEYIKTDNRFVVIHKENGGLVSARKAGCNIAVGEYIVSIDGDDLVAPDFLEQINNAILDDEVDSVCIRYSFYPDDKKYNPGVIQFLGKYNGDDIEKITSAYLYDSESDGINSGRILFPIWTKCVRNSIYKECQNKVLNEITSGEDTIFTLHWCNNVSSVNFIEYDGYFYRQNDSSIEHTINEKNFDNLELLYNEMKKVSELYNNRYDNAINVYTSARTLRYYFLNAQRAVNYKEFKQKYKDFRKKYSCTKWLNPIIKKGNIQSKIKMFILKHNMKFLIYILGKTWFKGKI